MAYTDLYLNQGADYNTTLTLTATDGSLLNVVGYVFTSQFRKSYYSANATANIDVTITDGSNGLVTLAMTAANTTNVAAGRYVYDIKMKDVANVVTRIVEGIITVSPQVTI
jgi:hypothetical protein